MPQANKYLKLDDEAPSSSLNNKLEITDIPDPIKVNYISKLCSGPPGKIHDYKFTSEIKFSGQSEAIKLTVLRNASTKVSDLARPNRSLGGVCPEANWIIKGLLVHYQGALSVIAERLVLIKDDPYHFRGSENPEPLVLSGCCHLSQVSLHDSQASELLGRPKWEDLSESKLNSGKVSWVRVTHEIPKMESLYVCVGLKSIVLDSQLRSPRNLTLEAQGDFKLMGSATHLDTQEGILILQE